MPLVACGPQRDVCSAPRPPRLVRLATSASPAISGTDDRRQHRDGHGRLVRSCERSHHVRDATKAARRSRLRDVPRHARCDGRAPHDSCEDRQRGRRVFLRSGTLRGLSRQPRTAGTVTAIRRPLLPHATQPAIRCRAPGPVRPRTPPPRTPTACFPRRRSPSGAAARSRASRATACTATHHTGAPTPTTACSPPWPCPLTATLAADKSDGDFAALCFECHGGVKPSGFETSPRQHRELRHLGWSQLRALAS